MQGFVKRYENELLHSDSRDPNISWSILENYYKTIPNGSVWACDFGENDTNKEKGVNKFPVDYILWIVKTNFWVTLLSFSSPQSSKALLKKGRQRFMFVASNNIKRFVPQTKSWRIHIKCHSMQFTELANYFRALSKRTP